MIIDTDKLKKALCKDRTLSAEDYVLMWEAINTIEKNAYDSVVKTKG